MFDPETTIAQRSAYYQPLSPRHPTFDSFIYDATSRTAYLFQFAVSLSHSAKNKGFDWICNRAGVDSVYYFVVTPRRQEPITIIFPRILSDKIKGWFHIQVSELPDEMHSALSVTTQQSDE